MAKKADRKTEGGTALGLLREIVVVVVGALIASTLLRMFLIQVFVIPSGSMENTLLIGDRVAVQKVTGWSRGDVVVFADVNGWMLTRPATPTPVAAALQFVGLLPDESQNYLIKRVIGLPGDHVQCCDNHGRVTVNGQALDEGDYLFSSGGETVAPSDYEFDVVVPQDRVFVMGDHRNDSADSRCHLRESNNGVQGGLAFVPKDAIVGSAVAVVFPFSQWKGLSRPATFAEVPAGGAAPASPVVTGNLPNC